MSWKTWLAGIIGAWMVAASVALLTSCGTVQRTVMTPLTIEGASYVGDHACAECHAEIAKMFPASPHARVHVGDRGLATGCESCHGPGSRHVAVGRGGETGWIINPGREPRACTHCHRAVEAEFRLAHRHPLFEGKLQCADCHDPHGADILKPAGGLAMARSNELCAACHREQTRHFVFEHEALREGCGVCHQPHGSIHAALLAQRDVNLCLKCHAQSPGAGGGLFIGQTDHSAFVRQGTCWSAGCHSAVHGSNVSPKLRF